MFPLLLVSTLGLAAAAPSPPPPLNEMFPAWAIPPPLNDTLQPIAPGPDYLFEYYNPSVTDAGEPLFESDIVLTAEQRADRKAAPNLWPDGLVRYVITSSSTSDRTAIKAAIDHWTQHTCVRLVEVPTSFTGQPHLRFTKQTGCWSYVGRISWPTGQDISIGNGCTGLGTIAHEIGHALGFHHEQSRPDRAAYITILSQNIQPGAEGNFGVASNARNYSVPYDLTSVMHYGSHYFSKNGRPTIEVNELQYSRLIGNRAGLSHRDKQLANAMYRCSASCSSPPTCQNGGYVDKTCRCRCPPGTSGSLCQTATDPYYGRICGNQAITQPSTICSLNWPNIYPPGKNCFWIIKAPTGKRVRVQFDTVKVLYRYSDGNCYWDWINLYTNDDNDVDEHTCGSELQNRAFVSTGRRLAVEMHSYPHGSYPSHQKGFYARVTFV